LIFILFSRNNSYFSSGKYNSENKFDFSHCELVLEQFMSLPTAKKNDGTVPHKVSDGLDAVN